jgi:hypothetical protein
MGRGIVRDKVNNLCKQTLDKERNSIQKLLHKKYCINTPIESPPIFAKKKRETHQSVV